MSEALGETGVVSLGAAESRLLTDCEAVIGRGLRTFVEVGDALLRIRDSRLYRETHRTFEDYCRERWGWTRQHVNRQISAARTIEILEPNGSIPNEAQARELAPLKDEPEALREAWEEAADRSGGKPTAADVREVVARKRPQQGKSDPDAFAAAGSKQRDYANRLAAECRRFAASGPGLYAAVSQADDDELGRWISSVDALAAALRAAHVEVGRRATDHEERRLERARRLLTGDDDLGDLKQSGDLRVDDPPPEAWPARSCRCTRPLVLPLDNSEDVRCATCGRAAEGR